MFNSSPGGCLCRPQLTASDIVETVYLRETVGSLQSRDVHRRGAPNSWLGEGDTGSELPGRSEGVGELVLKDKWALNWGGREVTQGTNWRDGDRSSQLRMILPRLLAQSYSPFHRGLLDSGHCLPYQQQVARSHLPYKMRSLWNLGMMDQGHVNLSLPQDHSGPWA